MTRLFIVVTVVGALAHPVQAQRGSRQWQPHERVVVADFGTANAVAATDVVLYVVSPGGIGVYNRRFRQWEPPVTRLDGFPTIRARAALVDPIDQSLWIAADEGLVHYEPRLRMFETIRIPGGAFEIVVDEQDPFAGFYVRGTGSWEFLPRGGVMTRPTRQLPPKTRQIGTLSADEAERRHPFVSTLKVRALTDDRLRRYRFVSATEVGLTNELFFGTNGYGVIRVDLLTTTHERLPFGLLAPMAASVLVDEGGVWVGSGGGGIGGAGATRSGLTFVSGDLQRYRYQEGPAVVGLGSVSVTDMIRRGRDLWVATDNGVVRVESRGTVGRLGVSRGLPSDRTRVLAEGTSGVWVGTRLGLAFVGDNGEILPKGDTGPIVVNALAADGDSVWVGSRQGLGLSWVGTSRIIVPDDVRQVSQLGDEVVAITFTEGALVVATRNALVWRYTAGMRAGEGETNWHVDDVVHAQLGELSALAPDRDGVWVAGERGIAQVRFDPRGYTALNTPGDVPGVIRDLASDDTYVWVATDGGLVRFTRTSIVP